MLLEISNKVCINIEETNLISKEIIKNIKEKLTFLNPEYITKEKMNIPIWGTPKHLKLYEEVNNKLIVPYGFLTFIKEVFYPYKITRKDCSFELNENKEVDYNSKIGLRDYQELVKNTVINAKANSGIIVMPAGSGKTQTSLEIIASLKKKTLWITHTQDLLKQSLDRAKANFDLNKEAFGTITSGKINLGTHITFATVQTLAKIDLNEIKDKFDMLVVDETHRVVANVKKMGMFQKIIESIPCRYKYGLTATEHRSDDLFDCVYYLIGNKLIDIDKETIKENLVPVNIKTINTSYNIINNTNVIDSDGTLVYSKMLSDMSLCATRNISILNILNKEKNEFNLVLSNRLEHLNELADKLDKDCKYAVIDGNTKKKLREQAIEDARNGNINFLFATFALAKEGLDIPRLNRLHLTQPVKDYAVVVQSLGRIARTFDNKDFAIAYDYSDVNVGMLKKQYRERCKHYIRENYKVI